MSKTKLVNSIFKENISFDGNFIILESDSEYESQKQTNEAFSQKWTEYDKSDDKDVMNKKHREWYLELYGFDSEEDLKNYLRDKKIIFDAGCGLGYKTAWFAELAPDSIVIGMDFSDVIPIAANTHKSIENLFFIKGDIANTKITTNSIDYVSCDQVLHHTENPENTFAELTRITKDKGEFSCYVYAKKAIPRELLDDYFREKCKDLSHDDLMAFSNQMVDLGKILTNLNVKIEIPDIPLLEIKAGTYDLQRFIYWNFIKCYWNEEMGYDNSLMVNYDWYSPSNANRYNEEEFRAIISNNHLEIIYFHKEEACYSGRFLKK